MLVATDVAARGIDIDDIGAVIHYEPAKDGRTTSTVPVARRGPGATAGRSRSSSTTSTPRCESCSARCACRTEPPIEVFSNNPNLRDLASFGADVTT